MASANPHLSGATRSPIQWFAVRTAPQPEDVISPRGGGLYPTLDVPSRFDISNSLTVDSDTKAEFSTF